MNNIVFYDVTDSTNKRAKTLVQQGVKSGTVVVANQQTAGIGRLGRSFYSPKDTGIYMSIILKPENVLNPLLITCGAAVAVYRSIKKLTGVSTELKWVNDVYYHNKKICGILAESSISDKKINYLIVGIGVNVSTVNFPDDLKDIAGSIYVPNKDQLILEIISQFEDIYNNLDKREFMKDYIENSFVIGKNINIIQGDNITKAYVMSINQDGHLIVKINNEMREISSGEVSIRINESGDNNE